MRRLWQTTVGIFALAAAGCSEQGSSATTGAAAGTSSAAAAPATTGSAAASAPTGGTGGDWHAVAEGDGITLYPMGDAAIVDTGAFYAVLGDGPLEQDPQLFRTSIDRGGQVTITVTGRFERFFGAWPDQPWAITEEGITRRVGDVWTKTDPLRENEQLLDLAPWGDKRAIAAIRMAEPDIRFTLVGSKPGGVVPGPGKPTAEQGDCAVRMDPGAELKLAGLPSGHLFAIGRECKSGRPIAERWQPGKVRGEAEPIEGVSGTPTAIAAASADEAHALFNDGETGYLATWDGKAWKGQPAPFGAGKAIFVSSDGVTWALGKDGLFKHPKGGEWSKVALPSTPTSAWAKSASVVWATDGKTLFRSGPGGGAAMKLPSRAEVQRIVERDRRWPATPACKKVYVSIATIGAAGDKAPLSFAALTEAVKGDAELTAKEIQYVVEESGGSLFAGAKVPNLATGEKLVAAFKAKSPKATPLLFCHEPAVIKGLLKVE